MTDKNGPPLLPLALVIPAYNRGDLIAETLESALNQRHAFAKIIVVDDGSTDNTAAVVMSFSPRVQLIRTVNQGVQAARNAGVAAATTDIVALCDSDDLLEPDFVTRTSSWMQQNPATDMLFCNFISFDVRGSHSDKFSRGPADFFDGATWAGEYCFGIPDLYVRTVRFQPIFPTGTVIRKEFFHRIGGYNPAFKGVGAEDWEFSLRAVAQGKVAACAAPLTRIRKHIGNDSHDTVRMNLGEVQILEHCLVHHPVAAKYKDAILASIDQRRLSVFDGAYASGDFKLAMATAMQLQAHPASLNFLAKRLVCTLPAWLRAPVWSLSQQGRNNPARSAEKRQRIVVIEPTWKGNAHLPGNLGLLRVVKEAYPNAELCFVGDSNQIETMKAIAPSDLLKLVQFVAWEPNQDKDPMPSTVWAAFRRLRRLPAGLLQSADMLVLCSCTATVLTALTWMGLASRTCAMLHGNAGELAGWRSRNPVRRALDLTRALKRFCRRRGTPLVLEERIRSNMSLQYPWLARRLAMLPHPLLPEEAAIAGTTRTLALPIQVGFAGLASIAKGFKEFLVLAHAMQLAYPGKFEFHAIGLLPNESKGFDQSALQTPAATGLPRTEFVRALRKLHYIFVWHEDNYYGNAASGVVYDAINLGIPMVARNSSQIAEWATEGVDVALRFDSIFDAVQRMGNFDPQVELPLYQQQCRALDMLRESLSIPALGRQFFRLFPLRHGR